MEGTPWLSRGGEEGAPERRNNLGKGSEALNVLGHPWNGKQRFYWQGEGTTERHGQIHSS